MKVNFSNFGLFHKSSIKKAFQIALEKTALDFECFYANVKFVSEEEIRDLNSTFRNIDKITDVLSFPNLELKKGKEFDIKQLKKEINGKGYHPAGITDQEKCIACAFCATMCPDCVITVEK